MSAVDSGPAVQMISEPRLRKLEDGTNSGASIVMSRAAGAVAGELGLCVGVGAVAKGVEVGFTGEAGSVGGTGAHAELANASVATPRSEATRRRAWPPLRSGTMPTK